MSTTRLLLRRSVAVSRYCQFRYLPLSISNFRSFATGNEKDDKGAKKGSSLVPDFLSTNLNPSYFKGVGQVVFVNNDKSGMIMLAGLAFADPFLAIMAGWGTVTSTAVARATQMDETSIKSGLMGYNGCLVGCATSVFVSPESVMLALLATTTGALTTPFVSVALSRTMSIPQWTFAFNIVTLTTLLRIKPLTNPAPPSDISVSLTDVVLSGPLKGMSQIFVVESAVSGLVLLGGMAHYSPRLALHALTGSTIGLVTGALLGAPSTELTMGLWGFNSALTSTAVGVFFVHNRHAMALSAGGAAATAAVFGALKVIFGAWGAPALTLPFCLTASGCYLLGDQVPGLLLAKEPHSPEQNQPKDE